MSANSDNRVNLPAPSAPAAKVYVLYTGGTFGMYHDKSQPGEPLVPMELSRLVRSLPNFGGVGRGVAITIETFSRLLDSSSMQPSDWLNIAENIFDNYAFFDGFVVIQGTDTLSYTASALSFMFENLSKPVVITGSQLPLENPRTDAGSNFGHSVMIAGYKATDLPRIPEVIVVFADKILRGCRTRKMSASAWTGFNSPNAPPLGEIGEHVRIFENQIRPAPPSDLELELNRTLTEDVLDISLYPGLKPEHLGSILGLQNVSGVVLRTYGSGNAPDDPPFLNALKLAMEDGNKTVVNITQCPQGTVEMGLYEASLGLLDVGVVSGLDMTPEAALTKLMVTMGSKIGDQVKLQMQINQRGEQSKNLFDLSFAPPQKAEARTAFSSNVTPDRRFDPGALSSATIRIKGFTITKANQGGKIYVYMNFPRAGLDEKTEERTKETIRNDTRCLFAIEAAVANEEPRYVVEFLEKIRVKNIIGQGDIVLTFLPTKGVEYSCEKITLSLFTQA